MSINQWFSLEQAAEALGMAPEEVEALAERGTLAARKLEGAWTISAIAVDNYRRNQGKRSAAPPGWERASGGGGGSLRSQEAQARRAAAVKQRMQGINDAQVRDRGSLELDLSVLEELKIPDADRVDAPSED
jgi:hypothetical protein